MKCAWSEHCHEETIHVHIMGCADMHITERPFCEYHSYAWKMFIDNNAAICHDCGKLILLTEIIPAEQVTHFINPVFY